MQSTRPVTFHRASFAAIGVANEVIVLDVGALPRARELAMAEVAALDRACSRFREDSELACLHARSGRPVAVSPLLGAALGAALDAAANTDGLVDPTVGASMRALGYDRDFSVLVRTGSRPAFELVPAAGWRSVRLDRTRGLVSLRRGTELDLGATAKAFAADRIAGAVAEEIEGPALVNLGGDVAVRGAPPGGWPVRVTDRHRDAHGPGQTVAVRAGGLATSSTTVRRWRAGRIEVHHILDPRSGAPAAEAWRTVSVAAGSCLGANTAATAAILLGAAAPSWLEQRSLAARLVACDGTVTTTGGWPPDEGKGH
jgi:FAD:protein FMN transferase